MSEMQDRSSADGKQEKRLTVDWERKLGIRTGGGGSHEADGENFPYEPTPYSVLERLAKSGYLTKDNLLVDYGCGKGRASFLLSFLTHCRVTGIDHNEDLIRKANENRLSSGMKGITFLHADARQYEVAGADSFFFFNPFSELVLKKVIDRILWSWYEDPRKMRLFFYYPTDEAVALLMMTDELMFADEIDCGDLFDSADKRERILIFETV